MAQARSLADLLRIRAANAAAIEAVNANLGSAVGLKITAGRVTGEPAVVVYVPRKISEALLPRSQRVPKRLRGPGRLWAPTDVVVGRKAEDEPPSPPLDAENERLVAELRGGQIGIVGGVQLGGFDRDGRAYLGTAACLARRRADARVGLLTNQHVGGAPGRPLYHPEPGRLRIGFTRASLEYEPDESYLDGLVDETQAYYRLDCAFVELSDAATKASRPGLHRLGALGAPLPLDLATLGPLGRRVTSVGRTRGVQRGRILAFAYEWHDGEDSIYTDYLVLGEPRGAFSDHGDSGKLIVSDDASRRPVALLWGGWFERLRRGHGLENWSYAVDVNKALARLEIEIVTGSDEAVAGPGRAARERARRVSRAATPRRRRTLRTAAAS